MEGIPKRSEVTENNTHLERLRNIIEIQKSDIILMFHRHLEHDTKDGEIDALHRLNRSDLSYTKDMSNLFHNTDLFVAFTIDNLRSYLTSYFLLKKDKLIDLEEGDQLNLYHESKKSEKIGTLKQLTYRDPTNTKFGEGLEQAFKDGTPLEFTINESDGFNLQGENISGYSLIASEMAQIVHKYLQIRGKWKNLSDSKYKSENLIRTFCAREFVYACFRAKITEKVLGKEERDKFVAFFSKTRNIKYIGLITFSNTGEIILSDNFGELKFDKEILLQIINENPLNTKDKKGDEQSI